MALLSWLKRPKEPAAPSDPAPLPPLEPAVPHTVETYGALLRDLLPRLRPPDWKRLPKASAQWGPGLPAEFADDPEPEAYTALVNDWLEQLDPALMALRHVEPSPELGPLHYAVQWFAILAHRLFLCGSIAADASRVGRWDEARRYHDRAQQCQVAAATWEVRMRQELGRLQTQEPALWQRLNLEQEPQAA